MANVPVVEHFKVAVSSHRLARVDRLADELSRNPRFELDERLQPLLARDPAAGPALCLDDMSAIRIPSWLEDVSYVMDRARLRAGPGDLVAGLEDPPEGYEVYCREILGLGDIKWLCPDRRGDTRALARACWEDGGVFAELVSEVRAGRLLALHPYMGSPDVWELAFRLSDAARRPLQVLAPPPAVTLWVNDKVEFRDAVCRLLGEDWVPPAQPASRLDEIVDAALVCAEGSSLVGIKTPDSAGGRGNLVLAAERLQRVSAAEAARKLEPLLERMGWHAGLPLLVGPWLTDVAGSPSVQLWIPVEGPPVVEGIYEQMLTGDFKEFTGSRPAGFPPLLSKRIAEPSFLLARLFQRLGYVGRCSFDLIIQGPDPETGRPLFVECNGRWGGTSIPMTLLNRLWGDGLRRPYVCSAVESEGLDRIRFADLLEHFQSELFDGRTRRGRLIFFNPGRMKERSGIEVIASGRDLREAEDLLESEFPESLDRLISRALTTR